VLLPDREWLLRKCDARATAMFEEGAVEEVRTLLARDDLPADATIRRAIGVPEVAALLAGNSTRQQAIEAVRLATRQYAKRQFTWFRNQPPPSWLRIAESEKTDTAAIIYDSG
jgi:tRNA dimethylallyltransferase